MEITVGRLKDVSLPDQECTTADRGRRVSRLTNRLHSSDTTGYRGHLSDTRKLVCVTLRFLGPATAHPQEGMPPQLVATGGCGT
jgi:hypothetical protein